MKYTRVIPKHLLTRVIYNLLCFNINQALLLNHVYSILISFSELPSIRVLLYPTWYCLLSHSTIPVSESTFHKQTSSNTCTHSCSTQISALGISIFRFLQIPPTQKKKIPNATDVVCNITTALTLIKRDATPCHWGQQSRIEKWHLCSLQSYPKGETWLQNIIKHILYIFGIIRWQHLNPWKITWQIVNYYIFYIIYPDIIIHRRVGFTTYIWQYTVTVIYIYILQLIL